jgi:hypothetical protein
LNSPEDVNTILKKFFQELGLEIITSTSGAQAEERRTRNRSKPVSGCEERKLKDRQQPRMRAGITTF